MQQLVGIVGSGMIGRDPFDERCWSGSSRSFFTALQRAGGLHRAFGVEAAPLARYALIARNFAWNARRWRTKFYLDADYYAALTRAVARAMHPDDFAHAFLQIGAIYDVPALVAGRTKCYSYHDGNLPTKMRSPFIPQVSRRRYERALAFERRVYEGLDHIFTMSEHLRRSFIDDFHLPPAKITNVGVASNWPIPDDMEKDYNTKEVLFVGIDFERKGGNDVLRAFARVRQRHPDAHLHIVGPRARPAALDPEPPGVRFHGFLSKVVPADLAQYEDLARRCTLFVMPTYFDAFGIAPIEAMVYKMPCIVSTWGALPEVVTRGEHGDLVEPGDVDALTEKMDGLLADPDARARQGAAARRRVLAHFNWERVAERVLAVVDPAARPAREHPVSAQA